MQDVGCGESHDPESHDQAADGENPLTGRPIVRCEFRGFAGAEDLATDTNGHQESAENEGSPSHGPPFYPKFNRCGKGVLAFSCVGVVEWSPFGGVDVKKMRGTVLLLLLGYLAGGIGFAKVYDEAASAAAGASRSDSGPETLAADLLTAAPSQDKAAMDSYIPTLIRRTKAEWLKVVPLEARSPLLREGRVAITFMVQADGTARNIVLERTSGNVALDRAAWAAITGSSPYAAFPAGVSMAQMKMRFWFGYNEKAQDDLGRWGSSEGRYFGERQKV